jgi:histidine triad (HIT) family protein
MTEYDPNNIFGKILRGEVPCHRLHEDGETLAFMDVMPQSPGHALVIPKKASRNLLDADPVAFAPALAVVQKLARAIKTAMAADGIMIAQFNEAAAGQTVFHLHFHVIPRYVGQELRRHSGEMEKPEILADQAQKIRASLAVA